MFPNFTVMEYMAKIEDRSSVLITRYFEKEGMMAAVEG